MRIRVSEVVDVFGVAAVAGGLGYRFGWWLAAVVAGLLVITANLLRAQ